LFFLFIGIRYLDYTNRYLEYGQEAILPFFIFHQPVIIILAYYAVQWQASLLVKLVFVVIGSFCVTLGIYEYLIHRIAPLSRLFGMKTSPSAKPAYSCALRLFLSYQVRSTTIEPGFLEPGSIVVDGCSTILAYGFARPRGRPLIRPVSAWSHTRSPF
jgi:hypothetical protein